MTLTSPVVLAVSMLLGSDVAQTDVASARAVERAKQAVTALKVGLKKELEQAMAAGGPESAVLVCRDRAQALAKEVGKTHNVQVGRSSHKLRNASNAPRPWVKPIIEEWSKLPAPERQPRVQPLGKDSVGYIESITTGALCLTCHGDQVPETLRAKIKASYPFDEAMGFKDGDLRGVFWAEAAVR